MTVRPFAYNPLHTVISGTTQVGDLAIGVDPLNYAANPGGIVWWNGPNEELGYLICGPVPTGNHPTPIGNIGTVHFWRSKALTDASFLTIVKKLSHNSVKVLKDIPAWLTTNGYWSSWNALPFVYMQVSSLGEHSVLNNNGQIWTWGYNYYGQLGNNSIDCTTTPVSIKGSKKTFCQIDAALLFMHAIDYKGQVWGWGYNVDGELGDNTAVSKLTPVSILGNKKTFCSIIGGSFQTSSIDYKGQVWGWGYNGVGQLGDNSVTSRRTPVSIKGNKKTFCKVSLGSAHGIGIDFTGRIWGWGYNSKGQLGDNTVTSRRTPVSILGVKKTFCNITTNLNHTVAIDKSGQAWGWGYNLYGQLGDNTTISRRTPVSILGVKKTFCQIAAGVNHIIGLDYIGQIWTWGDNNYGQLGDNTNVGKITPISILGAKKTFCYISAGSYHNLAIEKTGYIWSWGHNGEGQLGANIVVNKCSPASILGTKKTFCQISTGTANSTTLDYSGQIWSWGYNAYGELGINSIICKNTPISILGAKKTFCKIIGGVYHTIGIEKSGQIWSWGSNANGQLGDNTITNRYTPVSILGVKKTFCQIAGGYSFTTAIDLRGLVWGWGINGYGQLGNNTIVSKRTPVSILGAKKTFCQIAASFYHTVGLDKSGQTWCWGANWYGQLGDFSITQKNTPISIKGAKKTFCQITTGYYSSAALDKNGLVWGWGYNTYGELGNNTTASACTPVSILGTKKTFCQLSSGYFHVAAIDYSGQVWSWGGNYSSQLGDGTNTCRSTPVALAGSKKTFCKIFGGGYFTIGIDHKGQIWGWGENSYNQLTNTLIMTPVRVCNF